TKVRHLGETSHVQKDGRCPEPRPVFGVDTPRGRRPHAPGLPSDDARHPQVAHIARHQSGCFMHASRLIHLTVLVGALNGCRDATAPDVRQTTLAANRAKWAERGYTNYYFTLKADCFCALTGPVTVWVQNETVSRVTLSGSSAPINAPGTPTIKGLFDI